MLKESVACSDNLLPEIIFLRYSREYLALYLSFPSTLMVVLESGLISIKAFDKSPSALTDNCSFSPRNVTDSATTFTSSIASVNIAELVSITIGKVSSGTFCSFSLISKVGMEKDLVVLLFN